MTLSGMERFSSGLSAASKRLKSCSTLRWACVRREIAFMAAPYPAGLGLRIGVRRRVPRDEEAAMPKYLLEVRYTQEGLKGVVAKGGSARVDAAIAAAESAGGTVEAFYFAFGDNDVYVIADFPD